MDETKMIVTVRRQWNSWRKGDVAFEKLDGLRWDTISGGVCARAPYPVVHAYVRCSDIEGEIDHSGGHGPCPHRIKVCIVELDNADVWDKVLDIVGPKPKRRA